MSRPTVKSPCTRCKTRLTRSVTGVCSGSRPVPDVQRDGDNIYVDGLGRMSIDRALRVAHAIADAVTP